MEYGEQHFLASPQYVWYYLVCRDPISMSFLCKPLSMQCLCDVRLICQIYLNSSARVVDLLQELLINGCCDDQCKGGTCNTQFIAWCQVPVWLFTPFDSCFTLPILQREMTFSLLLSATFYRIFQNKCCPSSWWYGIQNLVSIHWYANILQFRLMSQKMKTHWIIYKLFIHL